ncbi:hypothetical protein D9619_004885 [Psilocybe cf. subviscida]|uniref:ASTRA-associated protein 1 n=1 Tax=Psilocybe cf. subviscida TaxID=2480587 RepID=A0A8H5F7X1_9AGAR|nr:hypothetical protein D9619_004885 [Psilocybe cf. subviscida]
MSTPPAPTPLHLLRSHSSAITALACSSDNERIYSADASGKVVITSTRSLRAIAAWNAHTDSILGVEEWNQFIVTHGRDNKLHMWQRIEELPLSARIGGSADLLSLPTPTLLCSMDVNALNFCRFSLLQGVDDSRALVAIPNLVDSSTADVWALPSKDRLHAAIGQEIQKPLFSADPGGRNTSGIVMSMHLYQSVSLNILMAYENGSVVLRQYTAKDKLVSIEGQGWQIIWSAKIHVESIMAMRVSRANAFAVTVSADHIVGRYNLTTESLPDSERAVAFRTKHAGNSSIALRSDGKVCAVGGWDGKTQLYSTKSFKALGILRYHKSAIHALEFAHGIAGGGQEADDHTGHSTDVEFDDEDELSSEEKLARSRWLLSGSKDNRVAIWSLIAFSK